MAPKKKAKSENGAKVTDSGEDGGHGACACASRSCPRCAWHAVSPSFSALVLGRLARGGRRQWAATAYLMDQAAVACSRPCVQTVSGISGPGQPGVACGWLNAEFLAQAVR